MDNIEDTRRLAKMNTEAVMAYERAMQRALADPDRISALYRSGFWEGDHNEQLQVLVTTAYQLLGTKGAAVLLITESQQRYAAAIGGPVGATEDLDASYCKYVVNEKHPFGVESAESHALVCTSKAFTQKGIRAYLGVPLCSPDGMVLGSFCVWEYHDRPWTEADVLVLTNLAATAAALEVRT